MNVPPDPFQWRPAETRPLPGTIDQLWAEHVQLMSKDYGDADVPDVDGDRRSDIEALIAVTPAATLKDAACKAKLVALAEREGWNWRRGHPARELARGLAADLERLSRSV